jgi:hypothetical protein
MVISKDLKVLLNSLECLCLNNNSLLQVKEFLYDSRLYLCSKRKIQPGRIWTIY